MSIELMSPLSRAFPSRNPSGSADSGFRLAQADPLFTLDQHKEWRNDRLNAPFLREFWEYHNITNEQDRELTSRLFFVYDSAEGNDAQGAHAKLVEFLDAQKEYRTNHSPEAERALIRARSEAWNYQSGMFGPQRSTGPSGLSNESGWRD